MQCEGGSGHANVLKVVYYHLDLQQSYAEAKNSGQTSPLGQADIDKLEVHHIFGPYYHWFHD
jgi:hypothetical protein